MTIKYLFDVSIEFNQLYINFHWIGFLIFLTIYNIIMNKIKR